VSSYRPTQPTAHTHCRTAAGSDKGCVSDKIQTLYFKYSGEFYIRKFHGRKETSFPSTVKVHNKFLFFFFIIYLTTPSVPACEHTVKRVGLLVSNAVVNILVCGTVPKFALENYKKSTDILDQYNRCSSRNLKLNYNYVYTECLRRKGQYSGRL